MYREHEGLTGSLLAILVQPLLGRGQFGHLSNERRVSKTINHWQWEQHRPLRIEGRVNSQRDAAPSPDAILNAPARKEFLKQIKAVGSWVVTLGRGRAHLEWACVDGRLLLLQLDFEDDSPDDGVDPFEWHRAGDHTPANAPPPDSVFERSQLTAAPSPWKKLENTRLFAAVRSSPFPALFSITGDRLTAATEQGTDLAAQLDVITNGRVVCRTDLLVGDLPRTNLPRTHTVTGSGALHAMQRFLMQLVEKGASPEQVCFILHKFIPASVGAWARADPQSQIVFVDSLWGVPDGLQYLPHDTFQYDVRSKAVIAERLRYKPRFVQEIESGEWQQLRVARRFARHRSLSIVDVADVAETSYEIAKRKGAPQLIMWFCCIPAEVGIGRNLPWFSMPPGELQILKGDKPEHLRLWPRHAVRSKADIERIATEGMRDVIIVLEPDVDFIRDDDGFLKRAIALAKERNLVVELAGSTLSHAYFELERSGVVVLLSDEARRSRTRRRRDFGKLVRDRIPANIETKGEVVVRTLLPRSELRGALVAKLFEEAQELLGARDAGDVKEEIADLLEVVKGLAATTGVDWHQVEEIATSKHDQRGGFETGAVLVETSLPVPDRPLRRDAPATSLRELGRVLSGPDSASVTFNALVAAGEAGARVHLGSAGMQITLSKDGILIRSISTPVATGGKQLELPL
jgi:predicted house-cleaning noncanonical NTP pyrophosphatase (MazG superfamily)